MVENISHVRSKIPVVNRKGQKLYHKTIPHIYEYIQKYAMTSHM